MVGCPLWAVGGPAGALGSLLMPPLEGLPQQLATLITKHQLDRVVLAEKGIPNLSGYAGTNS